MNRRSFITKSTAGYAGLAIGGLALNPFEAFSIPSDLRITNIRDFTIASNYDYPIIKVFTNQDVYGLGEVRDAGFLGQALMLKPYIVGKNPLNIVEIHNSVKHLTGHGRFGGGFSALDIALMDISGKVMGWLLH